jgi:hypothetical protein
MKGLLKIWGEPFKNVCYLLFNSKYWGYIISMVLIILSPIIIFYGVVYLFLIVASFIFWVFPDSIPIPFYHPLFGFGGDRFFMLIGIIVFIVLKLESKNRE